MLVWPTSSPKMTRMLGLRPDAAAGAGAGVAGAGFWACASAPDVIAAAATRLELPSRILRRLRVRSSVASVMPSGWLLVFSLLDIQLSARCTTGNHGVGGFLTTHRNPR